MIVGVTRGVHGHPFATSEADALRFVEPHAGSRHLHEPRHASCQVHRDAPFPGHVHRRTAPRRGLERRPHGECHLFGVEVARLVRVVEGAEESMCHDLGARCRPDALGTAVVIGVTVRHDNRVDSREWHADLAEPFVECGPRLFGGHAGVDHRHATIVFEHVHVHVTETGDVRGQLRSQHARGDFGDLVCRRQLFRLRRPCLPGHEAPFGTKTLSRYQRISSTLSRMSSIALCNCPPCPGRACSSPGYHRLTSSFTVETSTQR